MPNKYQESQEILLAKLTLDFISDVVFWLNKDSQIFMVNDAACKSLGYSKEELLKMKITDIDTNYVHDHWEKDWNSISEGN